MYISLLQTAGAAGSGSMLMTMLPLVVIFVIMYMLMIRPQRKKEKELQKMIASIKKGDKVVTIGGIHGTVSSVKEKTLIVKVEEGAKIEFSRSAVATVVTDGKAAKTPAKKDAKDESAKETQAEETTVAESTETKLDGKTIE